MGMSNPNVTIIGRLAADPEFKSFGSNSVAKFRVITSDRRKNEDGKWEDINTSGWNVVAWNNAADSCKNILEKGQEVIVIGVMKEDLWTDKEGNNRKSIEVNASTIAVTTYSIQRAAKGAPQEYAGASPGPTAWDETF
jgi:single-strand DNA-binding protein